MVKTHLKRNLIAGLAAVALLAGCGGPETAPGERPRKPNPVLLISFDGFRYDYLSKVNTPHFDAFAAEGVRADGLVPVFPSMTFPSHYSMATGLYPENSSIIGNTMYDPRFDERYHIADREAVEDPKWYEGEPIWNTVEKQGLTAGTMFWVGSEAPIQNMRPTHWKPFDGRMPFEARIDTVVQWLAHPVDSLRVDFATLYFEHVDKMGHRHGTDSDSLRRAIRRSDRLLGCLEKQMRQAGLWDRTNIIIVSDHGMADLDADKIIELDRLVDMDKIERVIWSPVTMIQPRPGRTEEVYRALKRREGPYRIYRKEELPRRFHIKNNRRVPDLVMVADLGYTILSQDYKPRFLKSLPAAAHGYDPSRPAMHAVFLARGPAFREDADVPPFQGIHLYELMSHLLGLRPAPNDGALDSVKILLEERARPEAAHRQGQAEN